MHARAFFASVSKILHCNRFLTIESKFCVFWYRKQILVLIRSCMRRRKIRFRYDTTSWFTDSPIASVMSCPQMPTAEPALAAQCTTKRRYTTRFGSGGGGTRRRMYIFVCMFHVYTSVSERGLWCNSVNKENSDVLVSPGTSYFLGPLIRIVSPVKSWIPRECTYIKIFAFARRVCKMINLGSLL